MYRAWIFTVGTELVHGRVINTNAAYLGRRLTLLGFNVVGALTLIDDVDTVVRFLQAVLSEGPRLVVTTGGLGPAPDDVTLEAVAKAVGRKLALNEEAALMIKRKYEERGLPLTSERLKMAFMPEGALPIPNLVGIAPGCWLLHGSTVLISLPGVPKEMEVMWESWVEPRVRELGPRLHVAELEALVVGVHEASLVPIVKQLIKKRERLYVKTHPQSEGEKPAVLVYMMTSGSSMKEAVEALEEVYGELVEEIRSKLNIEPKRLR